ncbi:MAG: vitamin K epoxide reductase family protein [Chloroflexi bacterium]|nr:vitamin K epoxide reductase family protein [Chloroflexota bacterium]
MLTLTGLGVAGYLAYVETQAVAAVCGPIGDCNAVQSSPYARLFGVLPIGVLGVIGYMLIFITWLWGRLRSDRVAEIAPLIVFGFAVAGVLFSLYLTFLEPFVIGAVCAWCLTSAVVMTLLMLLTLAPARRAFDHLRGTV